MKKIRCWLIKHFDLILLFIFCISVFSYIVIYVRTDIQVHLQQIIKINSNEVSYPPNLLFYFIVNLFSAFSSNKLVLSIVGITLLSSATVAKYAVSKKIISDLNKKESFEKNKIYLVALGLFFCFAIPEPFSVFVLDKMYLGKLVPIVWHNSTTIFLFPFAIWLFWKQLKVFDLSHKTTTKEILVLNILVVLNILIKPAFLFTYLPITFFFLLHRIKVDSLKKFLLHLTPLFTGTIFILVQYYLIYILQKGSFQSETSSVVITAPFEALSLWIPMWFIPISFFLSLTLPIFSMILFKEIIRYKPFTYSLFLLVGGIIFSAVLMETGPRMDNGNFMWQNIICTFLLMLSTVSFLTPKFLSRTIKSKKIILLLGLFLLHSLSGILYLIKISVTLKYH